jgi:transposase InsO family protein
LTRARKRRKSTPCAPSQTRSHRKSPQVFAAQIGLKACFTPVASPESNGVSEAFVKTIKRDYVQVSALPNAEEGLKQIGGWFEDYNENHPHSGLKMRSPREFIRASTKTA